MFAFPEGACLEREELTEGQRSEMWGGMETGETVPLTAEISQFVPEAVMGLNSNFLFCLN